MLYDKKWDQQQTKTLEPWRQVLLDAADLIEKNGKAEGTFTRKGAYCAVGAISQAERGKCTASSTLGTIFTSEALRRLYQYLEFDVIEWSDTSSKEHVIETMRNCAYAFQEI